MHTDELGDFRYLCTTHPEYFKPENRPPKIEYAYAITVHLSQGSEWDNVIYVVSNGCSKPSLYTAVTRAKQGCFSSSAINKVKGKHDDFNSNTTSNT